MSDRNSDSTRAFDISLELEQGTVVLALSMWGENESEVRTFEDRWRERLADLL
jgi:hypothetical protein